MIDFNYRDFAKDVSLALIQYIDSFQRLLRARAAVSRLLKLNLINADLIRAEAAIHKDIDELQKLITNNKK